MHPNTRQQLVAVLARGGPRAPPASPRTGHRSPRRFAWSQGSFASAPAPRAAPPPPGPRPPHRRCRPSPAPCSRAHPQRQLLGRHHHRLLIAGITAAAATPAARLAPMPDDLARGRVPPARPARQRVEIHDAIADLQHLAVDHPAPDRRLHDVPNRDPFNPHPRIIPTAPDGLENAVLAHHADGEHCQRRDPGPGPAGRRPTTGRQAGLGRRPLGVHASGAPARPDTSSTSTAKRSSSPSSRRTSSTAASAASSDEEDPRSARSGGSRQQCTTF